MMRQIILKLTLIFSLLSSVAASAETFNLSTGWVNEQQMKFLVSQALNQQHVLTKLNCRFAHDDNPGRKDVIFKPIFERPNRPIAWGWTFDANAPLRGPEAAARQAGFEVVSEDYFEISGVTWVRCKIWYRP